MSRLLISNPTKGVQARLVSLTSLSHSFSFVLYQRAILHKTQQELGMWIGSSVIHLGDTNVPNAVVFIGASVVQGGGLLLQIGDSVLSPA